MLGKILILLLVLTLCFGAVVTAGCQSNTSSDTATESKESTDEESGGDEKNEEEDTKGGDSNTPVIFELIGVEVQEGEVDENDRFVDEEDHGEVVINNEESVDDVADDIESQLKDIGAKYIVRSDSEDGISSEINASITAEDGSEFDYYTAIEDQDGRTNIFYMIQDHEERIKDLQGE